MDLLRYIHSLLFLILDMNNIQMRVYAIMLYPLIVMLKSARHKYPHQEEEYECFSFNILGLFV